MSETVTGKEENKLAQQIFAPLPSPPISLAEDSEFPQGGRGVKVLRAIVHW